MFKWIPVPGTTARREKRLADKNNQTLFDFERTKHANQLQALIDAAEAKRIDVTPRLDGRPGPSTRHLLGPPPMGKYSEALTTKEAMAMAHRDAMERLSGLECDCPDCALDAKQKEANNVRTFTDRSPATIMARVERIYREEKYNPYMPTVKGQSAELDISDNEPIRAEYHLKHPRMTQELMRNASGYFYSQASDVPEGKEANLTSSSVEGAEFHLPIFDLDVPCELVPSQTENHYHLYINRPVSWEGYVNVMWAMAEAGLVERGWVACSIAQGFATLRPTLSHVVEEMRIRIEAGEDPSDVLASLDTKVSGTEERTNNDKATKNRPADNNVPF